MEHVIAQDIKAYGLIPELCGRFPIITHLNPLNQDNMKSILVQPKNALVKQYTRLLSMDNITLHFEENALDFIVQKAMGLKLGARGLRAIMEQVMTDAMFNLDLTHSQLNITAEYVQEKCKHIFT